MRILSTDMTMQSSYDCALSVKQQTSVLAWKGGQNPLEANNDNINTPTNSAQNRLHGHDNHHLNLSQYARNMSDVSLSSNTSSQQATSSVSQTEENDGLPANLHNMKKAIESLVAWMSGRTVHLHIFSQKDLEQPTTNTAPTPGTQPVATSPKTVAAQPTPDWGYISQSSTEIKQSQNLDVGMQGAVTTADGRSINFNLSLSLSSSYYSKQDVETRAGAALTDPLVVNFGGQPAQLSLDKVNFDLASNGSDGKLAVLNSGSGYLALDQNGNGTIDNGSELFGPNSGNGLADLAKLDEDGNGWIDEGDSAFAKLVVYQPNSDGTQTITGLAKLGIGALSTSGVAANFDYNDSQNNLQGRMKQAGVFLYENGTTGSMQQIDMAA
jgi:hypothetical protein